MQISAGGGSPKPLTAIDSNKGEIAHLRPQFLPGGDRLLFTVDSNTPDSPQFAVLEMKTGTYRVLTRGGNNGRYVPSGHLTFAREGTLFAVPFDVARLTPTGSEVSLVEGISTLGPPGTADYAVSSTGTLVYMESRGGGSPIQWAGRKGTLQRIPGQLCRSWSSGRLSPDGRRLAAGVIAGRDFDLWLVDLDRGIETRLTFGGFNLNPVWTPDGRRIV